MTLNDVREILDADVLVGQDQLGKEVNAGASADLMSEIEHMASMGTGFFVTTPVFDLDEFALFYERIKQFGVPVIAEVILIRSAGMGLLMNKYIRPNLVPSHVMQRLIRAADKEKASIEIFTELVTGLRSICSGIHIVPFGAEERVGSYLSALQAVSR